MADVASKSDAVTQMHAQNAVIAALMGGTGAMRTAGKSYLPQWPQESAEAYAIRLSDAEYFYIYELLYR